MDAQKQEKLAQREQLMGQRRDNIRAMRSGMADAANSDGAQIDLSDEALDKPLKEMALYDDSVAHKTQFFSSYNPDLIEDTLVKYVTSKLEVEPLVSKDKYKIKFTLFAANEFNKDVADNVEIAVKILQVPDSKLCCVEFSRVSGQHTTFLKHFQELETSVLEPFKDSLLGL